MSSGKASSVAPVQSIVHRSVTEAFLRSLGLGWVEPEGDWRDSNADAEPPFAYVDLTSTIEIRFVPYTHDTAWAVYFTIGQPQDTRPSQHVRDVHTEEDVWQLLETLRIRMR